MGVGIVVVVVIVLVVFVVAFAVLDVVKIVIAFFLGSGNSRSSGAWRCSHISIFIAVLLVVVVVVLVVFLDFRRGLQLCKLGFLWQHFFTNAASYLDIGTQRYVVYFTFLLHLYYWSTVVC